MSALVCINCGESLPSSGYTFSRHQYSHDDFHTVPDGSAFHTTLKAGATCSVRCLRAWLLQFEEPQPATAKRDDARTLYEEGVF